jgi:hypothetical protein
LRAALALVAATVALSAAYACEPTVIMGTRFCAEPPGADASSQPTGDAGMTTPPVTLPWSTGFEDGFCDYAAPTGFCLATGSGSYTIVTSPVHSGRYAAEFTANSAVDGGSQARCVVQGEFPSAAYYGAWYYIPTLAQNNNGVWNLFHFQANIPAPQPPGLWDVSLVNQGDAGDLYLVNYDFVGNKAHNGASPVPIGQWFHIEMYFQRATDTTGQLVLLQDGVPAYSWTGLPTDLPQDPSSWGQWYVGNYATANTPALSTIYVDDVTIGATQ